MRHLLSDRQFHRFIAVGVLNTLVGYLLYALFLYLGFNYILASLFSTVLGVLFNFHSIGKLVFGGYSYRKILRFFSVYGLIYLLNISGLALLDTLGINLYLAGALLLGPLAIVSFVLNKYYVYGVPT